MNNPLFGSKTPLSAPLLEAKAIAEEAEVSEKTAIKKEQEAKRRTILRWLDWMIDHTQSDGPENLKQQWLVGLVEITPDGEGLKLEVVGRQGFLFTPYTPYQTAFVNRHGKFHKTDAPAVISRNGSAEWFLHGALHRVDGPAKHVEGEPQWWYKGVQRTHQNHTKAVQFDKTSK